MYNKIFTKILDSSIWLETDTTRIVWLTLIATMDEYGFCQFASVGNLAHRAVVPLDKATDAVKILESADLNSSDPDNEGRRIERVPGGWMVLNAVKYREIVTRSMAQEKTRNRVREKREREKSGYDAILKAQNHLCACCSLKFEAPYSLYVVLDHDHITKQERGLICQSCNKIVGDLENNKNVISPKKEICLAYIQRYKANGNVTPANGGVTPANGGVTPANGGVTQSEAYTESNTRSEANQKQPQKGESLLRYVEEREAERKANFSGAELQRALESDMRAAALREGLTLTQAKEIFKRDLKYATLPWIDSFDSQQELNLDELAAALPPAALARKVIEECALPCNSLMTRAVAGAISFCVKVEERSNNAAVEFLIAKTRDEIESGGTVNNFWFDDRKWRIKANGKSDAVAERQKAGRAQIDRAAARHLARITNKDSE